MKDHLPVDDAVRKTKPGLLARLLEIPAGKSREWRAGEIEAILGHQLAAPLGEDLGKPLLDLDRDLEASGRFHGLRDMSAEALLLDPRPPLEALRLLKDYARDQRESPDPLLPSEVAAVLYFGSIAAAELRHGERISTLERTGVRGGIEWILARKWLRGPLRALFAEAIDRFLADPEPSGPDPEGKG